MQTQHDVELLQPCDMCDMTFENKNKLRRHISSYHYKEKPAPNKIGRPRKCDNWSRTTAYRRAKEISNQVLPIAKSQDFTDDLIEAAPEIAVELGTDIDDFGNKFEENYIGKYDY